MKLKKIDESKFQCILYPEDLIQNHITLEDFIKNNTKKIHGLLDVIMEQARKQLGVELQGNMMSLQLAPQADHALLLTVSSEDDLGSLLHGAMNNIAGEAEGTDPSGQMTDADQTAGADPVKNAGNSMTAIFTMDSLGEVEELCQHCDRTWGIRNALYKDEKNGRFILVLERTRLSEKHYKEFLVQMFEYGSLLSADPRRVAYIEEHYKPLLKKNAINQIKKYCGGK